MTAAPFLAPRERPILFSAPMVLAILAGRKTVTRRLSSRYQVGDLLYVRETWWHYRSQHLELAGFEGATVTNLDGRGSINESPWFSPAEYDIWQKRPSIHMPKWAARIWLEVTAVRKERLQDITEEDARAEGVEADPYYMADGTIDDAMSISARANFAGLWDQLHGEGAWASNPEVSVIEFRRVK